MTTSNHYETLAGKTILILGGSSGIGRAVAQLAHAEGARLVLAGREPAKLDAAATALGARAVSTDITSRASLDALFAGIGAIDHLVITAGPAIGSIPFGQLALADARAAFEVKFWGQAEAVQAALGTLQPGASVTLTSGLLSRKFASGSLVKSTINAACEALTRALAKELAPLRVNAVSPGITDTEAWHHLAPAERTALLVRLGTTLPVGRVGQAEELAAAYLFAMRNRFMTGSVIDVDGGGLL